MTNDLPAQPRSGPPCCAVITGAANGVGEGFARALAASGAKLVLVDRDEIGLARLAQDLEAITLTCDVLCDEDVGGMFEVAEREVGHVALLVNAAGSGYIRTLGVMRSSREFARRPRSNKSYIVNVAARPDGEDGPFSYAGSEVAFNRLSNGLAQSIESPQLNVLTIERVETAAEISDLASQLWREVTDTVPCCIPPKAARAGGF